MPTIKSEVEFTDAWCEGMQHFQELDDPEAALGTYADKEVKGLHYRVGKRRCAFYYSHDTTLDGERIVVSKLLGHFNRHVFGVREARKEALKHAGRVAGGRFESKQTFEDAFTEYVAKLKRKHSPKWVEIVEGIGRNHLLPKWGTWRLDKLARSPKKVREWHAELTADAGPVAANKAARVLRAAYMNAAREDVSLPRDRHPCTSVEFNQEDPKQVAITDWSKWVRAWRKVVSPTRRAYHLFALASGARPGEAARLRLDGIKPSDGTLVIKKSKNGLDVIIPRSPLIDYALAMAAGDRDPEDRSPFVFSARGPKKHIVRFDSDGLPWWGNHLRHTYTSIAGALGFNELVIDQLTTHLPKGMSRKYFVQSLVNSGPALREAQARISRELTRRLGIAL